MNWSLIAAVNNDTLLESCLRSSPCFGQAADFQAMRGFTAAGAAYNSAMKAARGDILVFAHQDIYLPPGWDRCLARAVGKLAVEDPQWAVLGVWGITVRGDPYGHSYCTGLRKVLGSDFESPIQATSLDEALLVIRRSSGLSFDERMPGFHLFGTDICLTALQKGLRSYVIPAFCVHNTAGLEFLPWAFWRAYFYMRRKWLRQLPLRTVCTTIERVPIAVVDSPLRSLFSHYVKRRPTGQRAEDPRSLYRELVGSGQVQEQA